MSNIYCSVIFKDTVSGESLVNMEANSSSKEMAYYMMETTLKEFRKTLDDVELASIYTIYGKPK